MGIYISGVDMPPAGKCKTITIFDNGSVVKAHGSETLGKAIAVPEHGDLIDKQYAYQNTMKMSERTRKMILKQIDYLPIIIPADPVKEGE